MGTIGGLPFPEPTDLVTNGDDAIKALATAVDKNPRIVGAGGTATNAVQVTASAGWSHTGHGIMYLNANGWVSLWGRMSRATGSNVAMATFPAAFAPIENMWIPVNNGLVLILTYTGTLSIDTGNVAGATSVSVAVSFPMKAA